MNGIRWWGITQATFLFCMNKRTQIITSLNLWPSFTFVSSSLSVKGIILTTKLAHSCLWTHEFSPKIHAPYYPLKLHTCLNSIKCILEQDYMYYYDEQNSYDTFRRSFSATHLSSIALVKSTLKGTMYHIHNTPATETNVTKKTWNLKCKKLKEYFREYKIK